METLESQVVEVIWSNTITNDPNDCTIIVNGTSSEELAISLAKDLFKKDVTDKNGCIAHKWGAHTYLNEFPNTVFVYMAEVG